jgi:hypothetical protein
MYKKIIKALFEAKVGRSINESYATVKERFIRDGADKAEVKSLLDLHKKLKDMKRLKADEINIDVLAKGKSFDEFKSSMSRYSEKDTLTKTDKFSKLKNNIVAENNEWVVYEINTAEEAYLFHGLTKWCIVSGSETDAEKYFGYYAFDKKSNFYFIVRKNPVGDEWDYIALQLQKRKETYWDKDDNSHRTLPEELNVPDLNISFKPPVRPLPKSWKLNSDGLYDVEGDVRIATFKHLIINKGKLTIKFNKVTGDFDCSNGNLKLTSLEGCPKEVGESFYCGKNKLTSLEGAPKKVGGDFKCDYNKLTTLEGGPEKVGGSFYCYDNQLTSLKGAPKEVGKEFYCSSNKLTSLEGSPEKVVDDFSCSNNMLTSLKGGPKEVGGDFWCSDNKLTTLEGAPAKVGDNFHCDDNQLTSLKGGPKEVGKSFHCSDNKLTSLEGTPEKIRETFFCNNNKLTSLKGAPKEVGGGFYCDYNNLTSLEGGPKEVGGRFDCSENTKKFTKSDVENICKVRGSIRV